jgi:uncharacterized protein
VAFSGGVDSAVVACAAQLACGEQAVAITARSPSLAAGELAAASQLAEQIGIRHLVLQTDELAHAGYVANAGNRCYFCKSELYTQIAERRAELGYYVLCNGANADDLGDHRPGMQAAAEQQVRSPLIELGLNKAAVRELARSWGLPVWDKPASPCLASRIAYGVSVTPERLQRIDAAESWLRQRLGIRELRVRLEEHELARIELPGESISRAAAPEFAQEIVATLKQLGFRYVTLDLEGFRSGSLNEALPLIQLDSPVE